MPKTLHSELLAIENDMAKEKWEIVETSPMKKTFRKTSKPLETRKKPKPNINYGNPGGIINSTKL